MSCSFESSDPFGFFPPSQEVCLFLVSFGPSLRVLSSLPRVTSESPAR